MAETLRDMLGLHQLYDHGTTLAYLTHLADQRLEGLRSSEPQILAQSSHSLLLSVQGVSKRSQKSIVESAVSHTSIQRTLPALAQRAVELSEAVPLLDSKAEHFSTMFSKVSESGIIVRRKKALRLMGNSERLVDIMELPPLLAPAVNPGPAGHTSALELYGHVRRLSSMYPDSTLIACVLGDADVAVRRMAAGLIATLEAPALKLAAAIRTVGWLKRLVPDLVSGIPAEDVMPSVFLVCRLANLMNTLGALHPLRELADQERQRQQTPLQTWSGGQQTERYLKRFIEVFREHSFSIVSVSRSVASSVTPASCTEKGELRPVPFALTIFPLHLVGILLETIHKYLPIVTDQASRESIITQVLYCAASLGRLGADFSTLLACIDVGEWADLVKRHRQLAGRLKLAVNTYKAAAH